MAKTIYYLAASLDGFLARPDGNLDWLMELIDSSVHSHGMVGARYRLPGAGD